MLLEGSLCASLRARQGRLSSLLPYSVPASDNHGGAPKTRGREVLASASSSTHACMQAYLWKQLRTDWHSLVEASTHLAHIHTGLPANTPSQHACRLTCAHSIHSCTHMLRAYSWLCYTQDHF